MPTSRRTFKARIKTYIEAHYHRLTPILDVGPGRGNYAKLLKGFPRKDAVEIFAPYIDGFQLREKYRTVFHADIRYFNPPEWPYRLVVLGDVLEHLSILDAQAVLQSMRDRGSDALIAVPFCSQQHAYWFPWQDRVFRNDFEVHQQPDLTEAGFLARFPGTEVLFKDATYGVFRQLAEVGCRSTSTS